MVNLWIYRAPEDNRIDKELLARLNNAKFRRKPKDKRKCIIIRQCRVFAATGEKYFMKVVIRNLMSSTRDGVHSSNLAAGLTQDNSVLRSLHPPPSQTSKLAAGEGIFSDLL
ncbi:uncharacterized protein LOC109843388 isoform X2 [Asparagus officinalis]|uniref:uncharacterized protein LOC109843388 isoform X2 n=1 Tax=Asparagus officinalis TaxID=4686 RepID=UPI00098E070E|nr:uncharacterized protein LOC109843388 isoform X2 [Asparagus officinalis]